MTKIRTPRTVAQATTLLDRYAAVGAAIAMIETQRSEGIAAINAAADFEVAPLVEELGAVAAAIEPWWNANGQQLLPKGRKSLQLGGCMIGSKADRAKLVHSFSDDSQAVEALRGTRYGKQAVRVAYSLDKPAISKLLLVGNKAAKETIAKLGFRVEQSEAFFIKPNEQAGTIAG